MHASFKGPLGGVSIRANLVPEHIKDCWDKRIDKQVKCYSISSITFEEKAVMHENVKQLSAVAVNCFGGPKKTTNIHKYISKAGSKYSIPLCGIRYPHMVHTTKTLLTTSYTRFGETEFRDSACYVLQRQDS